MISFVLLLAGSGTRLNSEEKKQFIKINCKEIFEYSLEKALRNDSIAKVVLVVAKEDLMHVISITSKYANSDRVSVIIGGATRQKSVQNALIFIKNNFKFTTKVIIHDAARPLFNEQILNKEITLLDEFDAAVPLLKIDDSICEVKDKSLKNYIDRDKIYKVQTPQAFRFDIIFKCHEIASQNNNFNYRDDISLLDLEKHKISILEGDKLNFKLTDDDDLKILKGILTDYVR